LFTCIWLNLHPRSYPPRTVSQAAYN